MPNGFKPNKDVFKLSHFAKSASFKSFVAICLPRRALVGHILVWNEFTCTAWSGDETTQLIAFTFTRDVSASISVCFRRRQELKFKVLYQNASMS